MSSALRLMGWALAATVSAAVTKDLIVLLRESGASRGDFLSQILEAIQREL